MGSSDVCMYAEIRTRIPDTISWDYHFEPAGNTPVTFTVKVLPMLSLFLWCQFVSVEVLTFSASEIHDSPPEISVCRPERINR